MRSQAVEDLVLRVARENRSWGYRQIVGALRNLGHEVSHQTVANLLRRHGLAPAPERGKRMAWRDFIRSHTEVLAAVNFFTAGVWTAGGLMTYYVLTFMRVVSRKVWIAGITTSPDSRWMEQMARNVTLADIGFLEGCCGSTTERPHEHFDHMGFRACAAATACYDARDVRASHGEEHDGGNDGTIGM